MRSISKIDVKSMLHAELKEYFQSFGESKYRAEQVFTWLHKGAKSFHEMTNLPLKLRNKLEAEFYITVPEISVKQVSKLDGTIKYLWRLIDGASVESVVMQYEHGYSVCVSSQVGCRMGCVFCASAIGGLIRNLTASEIVDQVLFAQIDTGIKISNVVIMGMGEPLDNFCNVMRFIELINHPLGMNIGARHIVLSTCGITKYIDKLADHSIQLSLAVSLHAPDDDTRRSLMPVARESTVDELLSACARFGKTSGRRVTIEYVLIDGVNDSENHARLLARKLIKSGCHLNIILHNSIPGSELKASSQKNVSSFADVLKKSNINYTIRRRLGNDIDASCGQLRLREELRMSNET